MVDRVKHVGLIGIGGGSCSGKTTLARELAGRLDSVILPLDSYYRDLSLLPAAEREQWNFDHPDALEWPLLVEHLTRLAAGESVQSPCYDFATHTRIRTSRPVAPAGIVVVEGILALHDAIPPDLYRLRIFVDAPRELRLQRRVMRDVVERSRAPASVASQFDATVQPMHQRYVEPTRLQADLVVDGQRPIGELADEILALGIDRALRR